MTTLIRNFVQGLDLERCLEISQYSLGKQSQRPGVLSKVLIKKGVWKSLNTALASKIMD